MAFNRHWFICQSESTAVSICSSSSFSFSSSSSSSSWLLLGFHHSSSEPNRWFPYRKPSRTIRTRIECIRIGNCFWNTIKALDEILLSSYSDVSYTLLKPSKIVFIVPNCWCHYFCGGDGGSSIDATWQTACVMWREWYELSTSTHRHHTCVYIYVCVCV